MRESMMTVVELSTPNLEFDCEKQENENVKTRRKTTTLFNPKENELYGLFINICVKKRTSEILQDSLNFYFKAM